MNTLEIIAALKAHKVIPQLTGGQLKLVGETVALPEVLLNEVKGAKEELMRLLRSTMDQAAYATIRPVDGQQDYAATDAQKSQWVLDQLDGVDGAYNIVTALYLKGTVSADAMNKAFHSCINRHESLRTVFREVDGELRQVITDSIFFDITVADFSELADSRDRLRQEVRDLTYRRFDLTVGPLLAVKLIRLSAQEHALIIVIHHIISDGWSVRVLLQEVLHCYESWRRQEVPVLAPLKVQYKDYAAWLSEKLEGNTSIQAKDFWQKKFETEPEPLSLSNFARPDTRTFDGAIARFFAGSEFYGNILQYCKQHTTTPFIFFQTTLAVLLHKLSGLHSIVVGTPVAGRTHQDLQQQIGLFVNALPLATQVNVEDRFEDMLKAVAANTLKAFEYQDYPFARIIEDLPFRWESGRNPLFDVMLVLQDTALGDGRINFGGQNDFELDRIDRYLYGETAVIHEAAPSKFDLTFNLGNDPDNKFYVEIEYSTRLFTKDNIVLFYNAYRHIISQVLAHPGKKVKEIEIADEQEKHRLLETFNATEAPYDISVTVIDLFEEQVSLTPDHIGLLYEGRSLSYSQINATANRLAHYLRDVYSIGADDLVGIQLERNEWLVIALLGVLKSGGAYVPIDPAYPQERIEYIIADSRCKVVLDDRELQKFLLQEEKYDTKNPGVSINSADLAYIIYTSGSTGRPKGVMITHSNVSAFIAWCREEFGGSAYEVVLGVTSICFDLSVFEIFFTLTSGKQLRILESGLAISGYLNSKEPLLVNTVPSVVAHLLSEGADLSRVNVLNMAGEPIPANVIRQLDCERIAVRNLYGPSEDTTYSTIYRIHSADNILIGRPISNTKIYILGDNDHLQPVGVVGEICISGAGLARGYLNQPALTAEKFVSHPFIPGERLYRTGDLGRWQSDGNIVYLGRKDDQVKVRGYRIELGEIETVLHRYPGVEAVVVTARAQGDGDKVLVAYVACKEPLDNISLRSYLKSQLPDYMVPGYFVRLSALPLLPNGKINKKALPAPEADQLSNGREYEAPRNELESRLADIWSELLGQEQVSVKDNFFELGGHSLKATRLSSRIYKAFEVKVTLKELFTHPVLEDLAGLIAGAQKSVVINIPVVPEQSSYVLSSAQRRLWVLSQFEEGSIAYNMPGVFEFEGTVNIDALSQSFDTLIARHESLRTVFRGTEDGEVRQHILSTPAFKIDQQDLRNADETRIQAAVQASVSRPFDLSAGPLLRAELFRINEDKWVFVYVMHHIISDGWSMEVLIRELLQLYHAYAEGQVNPLSPLRIHYKDYAVWQQQQLQSESHREHKNYWLQQLGGELPVLELPADKPRPAVKTYNGASISRTIPSAVAAGLKALCQSTGSTLFMGLLGAVKALLYRYTGQEDIIVGSPVAGREHSDLEGQIGFYVNTLALRTQFSGTGSYKELLSQIKQTTLDAYQHQSYPFDELVDELPLQRDMSRSALFDVLVVMEHGSGASLVERGFSGSGLRVRVLEGNRELSKFDLQFSFIAEQERIVVKVTYNTDLYETATIGQLAHHLERLLAAMLAHPDTPVGKLDYLGKPGRQQLLAFNSPAASLPASTLVAAFRHQASATPDNTALVFEQVRLTYQELNEASERLGAYLRATYGLQADDLVGIQLERSEWMIIALLGILKAGAAFVPIDPAYPQERIDYITADSRCRVVINQQELNNYLLSSYSNTHQQLEDVNTSSDLAYIIYTSGSTGRPKGVMISHGSLYGYITTIGKAYGITSEERVLQLSNFAFDASVEQIMVSLLHGASLHVINRELTTDTTGLSTYIAAQGITHLHTVPTLLQELNYSSFSTLKRVVSAGEPCPASLRERVGDSIAFYNKYGPTEATISATLYHSTDIRHRYNILPIGHPLPNSRVYILNEQSQLQPLGVSGEICIGGSSVARGYLNQPELTAEKFIADPYYPGDVLYRTGDLGKWLPDGSIMFLGRKDDQVKVRGHRIEPGEIAGVLEGYEGISAAVVTAVKDSNGEPALAAYVVGTPELNLSDIRKWLGSKLPHYMQPAHLMQLEALPLLPNGKVNRKALPTPEDIALPGGVAYAAPRTETEIRLVQIWQDILGREHIGIKHNFFELGGHSLKATRLAGQLHKTFNVRPGLKELFFAYTIEAQAALIEQLQHSVYTSLPVAAQSDSYPMSSAQRRLWVLSQFEEGSTAYNMPGVFEFAGALNTEALSRSFDTLITRHESLRTIFREAADGEVRQHILTADALNFRLHEYDFRDAGETMLQAAVRASLSRPFDLSAGPLLRAELCRINEDKWVFVYVMHHIISDGWSMEVLVRELLQLYHAYVKGQINPLSPLRIHYKDYAVWQQQQLQNESLVEHKSYWLQQLGGELPVLELPADKPRPAVKTYNGASISRTISPAVTAGLKALCLSADSTLFMGLLAAVKALLYRYTAQEDIIIGSPVAGREHSDLEGQIGFYVNTLALRTQFSGAGSYLDLLSRVRQTTLDAYQHQSYPFDELVEELPLHRDMSRNALFDVMVVLQHQSSASLVEQGFAGLEVRAGEGTQQGSKFDLQFSFVEAGDQLQLHIAYNTDIYQPATISRLSAHLEQLLTAIIAAPSAGIGAINYLSGEEKTLLQETFNDTEAPYDIAVTVIDLFEKQVSLTPDHIGLLYEGRSLSYSQINSTANRLAHYLRDVYGIGADDLVGIQLERNEWLVIALLGVLKSGGAYVPIDPAYPQERIEYIIADSRCKVVLDDRELQKFLLQEEKYDTENPGVSINSADLAYIIYTSGSTGRPKGVMITHSNVSAFIAWCREEFGGSAYEVVLAVTSICFDLSVFEIFFTLTSGKQLRILESGLAISGYLNSKESLLVNTVPSVVAHLLSEGADLSRVNVLNMAGEPIPANVIRQLDCERIAVRNLYGPSEDTTYSTIYRIHSADNILIGRPISNTKIYILGDNDHLQPVGVVGEICISGAGLARGYLNQPALTAEKFVSHPFIPGERLYRTGDLGRWQPDGNIVYLGRKDDQVKVRGYRIELGEIETVLHRYPGVEAVVVTARAHGDGDKVLVAYVACKEPLDNVSLRSYLKSQLPDYMVPGYFVQLSALPLLPNGKINKKALPAPEGDQLSRGREYEAPRNELESRLADIWSELLGQEQVSVKDNFFELGGHSLKATRLSSRIYKAFEVKVTLKELFTHPVLEDLAGLIAGAQKSVVINIPVVPEQSSYVLSSAQRRLWVLSQFEEGSIAYNMPGVFEFEGTVNIDALSQSFDTLIARHESLRTVFRGTEDGEVRQHILSTPAFKIDQQDLRNADETMIQATVQASISRPFDLSAGPLLRAELFRINEDKWVFVYVMHHIISDGWSMEVLIRELLQLYHAYAEGQVNPLSPLRIHYKDYAVWQQQQLQSESHREHKNYWLQQLGGELPVLELPADKPRPAVKTYNGASISLTIPSAVAASLKALCQSTGSTLFMGLLGAVKALLYRYTGQEDMIVGSPVAGREHSDLEGQIGFYVNTLALRTQFSGAGSYKELLSQIKQTMLDAYQHQSYPFDELVDELSLQRDMSRSALFDVLVVMEHGSGASLVEHGFSGSDLRVRVLEGNRELSKFDLQFSFIAEQERIAVKVTYNTDLYETGTIVQLAHHLEQLLAAMLAHPDTPVGKLDYLGQPGRQQLLAFNSPTASLPASTLVAAFRHQASATPDNTALVFEQVRLTYQELNEASERLGAYLRATYGLQADDLVGIQLERSEWMIIALLGILKAGAAFVPIDPAYPQERIDYITADSRCRVVINQQELNNYLLSSYSNTHQQLEDVNTPSDLAYIIYTSGSTGRPKGVMISHGSLYGYITTIGKAYGITSEERVLQLSNFAFDASVEQIMVSLLHGASLHVINRELTTDTTGLSTYIAAQGITHLHTVPTLLQELNYSSFSTLKRVVSAGEPCPASLRERVGDSIAFYNKYGPTEATISATLYHSTDIRHRYNILPIGHPLPNSRVYILNEQAQLQPLGVAGEICIGGSSVARGYLNQPELTAEKFIADPYYPGDVLYRTGDLGKWLPDGSIMFLGRKDDQVKVRGHRIEPGEIAGVLEGYEGISAAVVTAVKDRNGEPALAAYVVGTPELNLLDIRKWLGSKLPHYMQPAHLMQLEALPLLPNGKVNRKTLPTPEISGTVYVAPGNPVEARLVQIWQDLLGKEQIGIKHNFFELGGQSLKATRLLSLLQKEFGIKLSIKDIFLNPTIETLGEMIRVNMWLEQSKNNRGNRILAEI
ncbi:non-ribosomal peptide synthetase [Chitinophaga flava]|uniref:Carrier domain-containing protein n=1 Tax=Chitinophaga flava TaxID=2259036 RepID=A0A365XUM8_9BACT|nr:non-ribosomal peptide synthetase [Chitinophaga flava]RBL90062.1 hypothetical protein DF182_26690 [Chitinophaga flava]